MFKQTTLALLLIAGLYSCKKDGALETTTPIAVDLNAPNGFNYSPTRKVNVSVRLLTRDNQPLSGVLVSVFEPGSTLPGTELTKVVSDGNGYASTTISIPSTVDSLVIDPAYIGLARKAKGYISGNTFSLVVGGSEGVSGNIGTMEAPKASVSNKPKIKNIISATGGSTTSGTIATKYILDPNGFDLFGRPRNLAPVDKIDFASLLKKINTALPEGQKAADKYIKSDLPTNLTINTTSDVWITFLHEGADYQNTLGYYTYPTNNPPKNAEEIDSVFLILPNASLKSGTGYGNMLVGDKVKLGRFSAGTSIGFVLLQDAYKYWTINTSGTKFYTDEALNPETSSTYKKHAVLLQDAAQKLFIVGFEDKTRGLRTASDDDFNDIVFYAQSNPVEAISPGNIPHLEGTVKDTDKDGIPDQDDKYPNDPKRAYDRYYPSESTWGTLAFEDMWPEAGDYDMNDLVVSYRYKFAMSADNKVVDMTAEYKPLATGADFNNGFGVELPLTAGQVSKVTGHKISGSYLSMLSSGLEAGQSNAVFIPFDNVRSLFGNAKGYINTIAGNARTAGTPVTVTVEFTTPLSGDFTSLAPFNPFMISNQIRGNEVHLVNKKPTSLANLSKLGTAADDSKPASGKYYATATNSPFALDIFGEFKYPAESKSIYSVYESFKDWAKSGGTSNQEWLKKVNTNLIY